MTSVAYASFCCPKDQDRVIAKAVEHADSHEYPFDAKYFVFQRCKETLIVPEGFNPIHIQDADYPKILAPFGIQYPDPVLDTLTHGWDAPHFWAHHMVNHLAVLQQATSDYIVFADGDCYVKDSPANLSWITEGLEMMRSDKSAFVVCPNDGGPSRMERIMSQQMFLVNRKRLLAMDWVPWDGKFIEGGPFQEYYGLLEGWIGRYLEKRDLWRVILPSMWRYWHCQW